MLLEARPTLKVDVRRNWSVDEEVGRFAFSMPIKTFPLVRVSYNLNVNASYGLFHCPINLKILQIIFEYFIRLGAVIV